MATNVEGKKTRLRKESEGYPQEASITPASTIAQPSTITPETRDQLTLLMQDLLLKTQELSFEFSTLDCDEMKDCPLANKCKELFKTTKKIHEFVRKIAQPTGAM
jgi:hypothetical protein